ncbi:MAG: HdeD family acid-resistance protein [Gammaproteobacteria bacterium]|nr:HdeD family acid-resistance protein [Gammaproteobacteria bacterium]
MSTPTLQARAPYPSAAALSAHWILFLVEGITLLILGTVAILVPVLASVAATLFFGSLLLVSGCVALVATLRIGRVPGFTWSLLSALVTVAAGVLLLWWPVQGTVSLIAVLIAFLLVDGTFTILYALDHRRALSGRWGWMLASGILDILFGVLLLMFLPAAAFWALGLLVGVDMIFGGWALIFMTLHARHVRAAPAGAATSAS